MPMGTFVCLLIPQVPDACGDVLIWSISGPFLPCKQLGGRHLHCEFTVWDDSLTSLRPLSWSALSLMKPCVRIFKGCLQSFPIPSQARANPRSLDHRQFCRYSHRMYIWLIMNDLANNVVSARLPVRKLVPRVNLLSPVPANNNSGWKRTRFQFKALLGYLPHNYLQSASSKTFRGHMWLPKNLPQNRRRASSLIFPGTWISILLNTPGQALGLAGMESAFFIAACTVLCFGCCWTVFAQHQIFLFYSFCPAACRLGLGK